MSVKILSAIQRYRIKKIDEKDRWIHLNLMSSKTIKQSYIWNIFVEFYFPFKFTRFTLVYINFIHKLSRYNVAGAI